MRISLWGALHPDHAATGLSWRLHEMQGSRGDGAGPSGGAGEAFFATPLMSRG